MSVVCTTITVGKPFSVIKLFNTTVVYNTRRDVPFVALRHFNGLHETFFAAATMQCAYSETQQHPATFDTREHLFRVIVFRITPTRIRMVIRSRGDCGFSHSVCHCPPRSSDGFSACARHRLCISTLRFARKHALCFTRCVMNDVKRARV